jgi:type I restriction enzyme, S subunit
MKWFPRHLDELGHVSRGKSRHRPRDAAHLYGGPFPFVQTGDVKHAGLYITDFKQTYSEAGLAQSKLWPAGTLCITIAANIADTAILRLEACFPDSVIGFIPDPNEADARFVKYLFDATIQQRVKQFTQGSAQDNLSQEKLFSLEFLVPRVEEQQRIASIFSTYDVLIENNKRRIVLLEESVRQVYKEWFVRLRFPGCEHTRIVNGVPEGWRQVTLGSVASKIGSGFTPRGGDASYSTEGVPLIRSLNVYNDRFVEEGLAFIDENQAAALANVTVQSRDILLNITGASVARCCMAPERHLPARVNQHVMIIRCDPALANPFLVHAAINSDERKRQLLSYAQKGSTREALTKEMVANFDVYLPTHQLMAQFGDFAEAAFIQRENLALQNQKLRAARDLLLPKLMSGEISV